MRLGWFVLSAACLAVAGCGEADDAPLAQTLCDPKAQGLAITEIMADPAGLDQGREWLELANFGPEPVALARMVLSIGALDAPRHVTLTHLGLLLPGHLVVLGSGTPETAPIDVSYGAALEMPNDAGIVALYCRSVRMAAVVYGASDDAAHAACAALDVRMGAKSTAEQQALAGCAQAPAPKAGSSLSWDKDAQGGPVWHQSRGAHYDDYNVGSPKEANLGADVCRTHASSWRRIRRPGPGDVRIVAVFADPIGPDDGREWIVLRGCSASPVDLCALGIWAQVSGHKPRRWWLEDAACHAVARNQEVRIRIMTPKAPRAGDMFDDACGDDGVVWGPTLPNQAMRLAIRFGPDAPLCDAVDVPKARCGVAWVRDGAAWPEDAPTTWPPFAESAP